MLIPFRLMSCMACFVFLSTSMHALAQATQDSIQQRQQTMWEFGVGAGYSTYGLSGKRWPFSPGQQMSGAGEAVISRRLGTDFRLRFGIAYANRKTDRAYLPDSTVYLQEDWGYIPVRLEWQPELTYLNPSTLWTKHLVIGLGGYLSFLSERSESASETAEPTYSTVFGDQMGVGFQAAFGFRWVGKEKAIEHTVLIVSNTDLPGVRLIDETSFFSGRYQQVMLMYILGLPW